MTGSNKASSSSHIYSPAVFASCSASFLCGSDTYGFVMSAVMPLPIADGVFGIVRIMGWLCSKNFSNVAMDVPAAIERSVVCSFIKGSAGVRASLIICGLTAMIKRSVFCKVCFAFKGLGKYSTLSIEGALGLMMLNCAFISGAFIHDLSRAPPIFPQPSIVICAGVAGLILSCSFCFKSYDWPTVSISANETLDSLSVT